MHSATHTWSQGHNMQGQGHAKAEDLTFKAKAKDLIPEDKVMGYQN